MLQPHEDYFLLVGLNDTYLLLKGTERLIEVLSEYMPHKGLVLKQYGPTNYIPTNGCNYNWYMRIEKLDGSKPSWQKIAEFLAYYNEVGVRRIEEHVFRELGFAYGEFLRDYKATFEDSAAVIERLEEKCDEYETLLDEISCKLDIAGTPWQDLPSEIESCGLGLRRSEELEADIEILKDEFDDYEAEQEFEIEHLKGEFDYHEAEHEFEIERLKDEFELEKVQQELDFHNKYVEYYNKHTEALDMAFSIIEMQNDELTEARESVQNTSEMFEEVFGERDELETKLIVASEELELHKRHAAKRQPKNTSTLIQRVLPGVEFMWDSLAVAFDEFADPLPTLSCIGEIIFEKAELKLVAAASGWYELTCSTGRKRDGRIYFTKAEKGGLRRVYISRKQRQQQDIERLKQNPAHDI